ncbi:hypothetical protein AB4Z19_22175 [Pseudoduganella sp. RAF19]|jgi:hypothetical protein|uniref:hypothetical protein n=1 Tax=Pseudoduganella sp. RAF19 TaxID=3233052 RepID=UPI003F96B2BE
MINQAALEVQTTALKNLHAADEYSAMVHVIRASQFIAIMQPVSSFMAHSTIMAMNDSATLKRVAFFLE